jgi:3-phenylpropionate/cinnamic acid dioxygenase small subunit
MARAHGAAVSIAEAAAFLAREARLLDAGEHEAWLGLWDPRGIYWIPAAPGQQDARSHASILHEDLAMLRMRVARLSHPRAYALDPRPRSVHVVGSFEAEEDAQGLTVLSALLAMQYRDGARDLFAARVRHRLVRQVGELRILEKRVDLVDCDGVHAANIGILL